MPLMGSLYVGSSGLQTSQNSLNATAHNMSNLDTTGYVRQQILHGDRGYTTLSVNPRGVSKHQVGLGVNFDAVRQVRDEFLDATYRKEVGRSSYYEKSFTAMNEVEELLGEMDGVAFADSIEDLWQAVQEIAKTPDDPVRQGLLVQRASAFIERAGAVYNGLSAYQDNLNLQVKKNTELINQYAKDINILNDAIRKVEAGGKERANDLRDGRNQLLDELSALGKITYREDSSGAVSVSFEGESLVSKDSYNQIALKADTKTGFYTPYWPQSALYKTDAAGNGYYDITNAKVFDLSLEISSDIDTDIGGLKAVLLSRGDKRANYTDLADPDNYNENISKSTMMHMQAQFDQLIHAVTTKVNSIFAGASDPATGYFCNTDGSPMQLFERISTPDYVKDALGNWVYVAEDPSKSETLFSIKNITINPELVKDSNRLSFIKPDGPGETTGKVDFELAEKLKKAFEEEAYTLNPTVETKSNFNTYYSDLVSQVANTGLLLKSIATNQATTVKGTDGARQQIIGVSSEEELTNMIKFQNAYNASSRYINVISEMLEHVVSTLGR